MTVELTEIKNIYLYNEGFLLVSFIYNVKVSIIVFTLVADRDFYINTALLQQYRETHRKISWVVFSYDEITPQLTIGTKFRQKEN